MSSDIAVSVREVGKRYRLGERTALGGSLRDMLGDAVGRSLRRDGRDTTREWVWALKDVTFDVEPGEVLGVIGRNGAGKTTLLKILSGVTDPTTGKGRIRGRLGALLEVGTGFHPDLTGRENVYLNGAILGMRRREIDSRFDEIVEFCGFQRFIDTPVKRYSSGMYLRLAFSVAAHLEPDVLLVDEVLAVGDAEFQRRCLGKMGEVARAGRTVLFVSHNMHVVSSLCGRAILLDGGRIVVDGPTEEAVRAYLGSVGQTATRRRWEGSERPGNDTARLVAVEVSSGAAPSEGATYLSADEIVVTIEADVETPDHALVIGFDLVSVNGTLLFRSFHTDASDAPALLPKGRNILQCSLPRDLLNAGQYWVSPKLGLHPIGWFVEEDGAVQFEVVTFHGARNFQRAEGGRPGALLPMLEWQVHQSGRVGESTTARR
jgi:lipopolysaccharide transport system ATP-binding protein